MNIPKANEVTVPVNKCKSIQPDLLQEKVDLVRAIR